MTGTVGGVPLWNTGEIEVVKAMECNQLFKLRDDKIVSKASIHELNARIVGGGGGAPVLRLWVKSAQVEGVEPLLKLFPSGTSLLSEI